jgi:hypothetical protein
VQSEKNKERRPALHDTAVHAILGMRTAVPLHPVDMAKSLSVTFYPVKKSSQRVQRFAERLKSALERHSVQILRYTQAQGDTATGKLKEGIVVISQGELETGDLPVDHVPNLRRATLVGIIDGPCPAETETRSQEKLNSIVKRLAWNIEQMTIYVDETTWTVVTMNGAVIRCSLQTLFEDTGNVLIPKLAAPVVPPHASDFDVRDGGLNLQDPRYATYVKDFQESGKLWHDSGLMLFHTSLADLEFRNKYYRRLAGAYLDNRSGMSYGFLARQIATPPAPTMNTNEAIQKFGVEHLKKNPEVFSTQTGTSVAVHIAENLLFVQVPDVWVLMTRSGCDKSNIDPLRDLVLLGLAKGKIVFCTPRGMTPGTDCKPSYDTLTILAHAAGNALVAAIQHRLQPGAPFESTLAQSGLALAHWHGYLHHATLPAGYVVYGESNPPVSCSTMQAAILALHGKVDAFAGTAVAEQQFAGDVHVEPHHGVNLTGSTLVQLGQWAMEHLPLLTEIQVNGTMPQAAAGGPNPAS